MELQEICLIKINIRLSISQYQIQILLYDIILYEINVREHRRGNQKWTNQRKWQHRRRKTQTQYVLATIIRKQSQIT